MQIRRKGSLHRRVAGRTRLDFGIHMLDDLLEQDIDLGAPLMSDARLCAQALTADIAVLDGSDPHRRVDGTIAGHTAACTPAFPFAPRLRQRGVVRFTLREGNAGGAAGLPGLPLQKDREDEIDNQQKAGEERLCLIADLTPRC